jgi:hypothetical protein
VRTLDYDAVAKLGLALPDVVESTSYGAPALKLKGKLLACVPSNKSAEPGSIVVRIDLEQRAELLRQQPAIYYITEHYTRRIPPCSYAYQELLARISPDSCVTLAASLSRRAESPSSTKRPADQAPGSYRVNVEWTSPANPAPGAWVCVLNADCEWL